MSGSTVADLEAPYPYVVSEDVVRDVSRLLHIALGPMGTTSVVLLETQQARHASILDLEGLGIEVWAGVDPKRYIDELRDEWNHR
jgi:hypothetical protein